MFSELTAMEKRWSGPLRQRDELKLWNWNWNNINCPLKCSRVGWTSPAMKILSIAPYSDPSGYLSPPLRLGKMWSILPNWGSDHHSKTKSFFFAWRCPRPLEAMTAGGDGMVGVAPKWTKMTSMQMYFFPEKIRKKKNTLANRFMWQDGSFRNFYMRGKGKHLNEEKNPNSMLLTLSSKGRKRGGRRLGSCPRMNVLSWRTSRSLSACTYSIWPLAPFPYAERSSLAGSFSFGLFCSTQRAFTIARCCCG